MGDSIWSVQDAKNHFSEMLTAAKDGPQTVTRHGKDAAVVLSPEDYQRLKEAAAAKKMTFNEMLLAIPKAPDDEVEDIFPRVTARPRDVEF